MGDYTTNLNLYKPADQETGWSTLVNGNFDTIETLYKTGTVWSPDANPASPSIYDDEFDDSSFDSGKWTEFDVSTSLTVSEHNYGLVLTPGTSLDVQGIFQEVPAGENWSIMTKISWIHPQADDQKAGLFLLEDKTNLSTSKVVVWAHYRGSAGMGLQAEEMSDYNSWSETILNFASDLMVTSYYLRIRATGGNLYFDYSTDGLGWMGKSTDSRYFTPQAFGIFVRAGEIATKPVFSFFRYVPTYAVTDVLLGDRVNIYKSV